MSSTLPAYWLSAVMLAALLLCAPGAPVGDAQTESVAGDTSGEEEEVVVAPDLLSESINWKQILDATSRHIKEFEDEFAQNVKYNFLDNYKTSSIPAGWPSASLSKEACLQRLANGLHTYMVLFKHVEREYPSSLILSEVRYHSGILLNLTKEKMRHPERVSVLNSNQEEQLLRELNNPDTFHRKMMAHSILRQLRFFLLDGRVAVKRREVANISIAPISFYYQTLKKQKE